jgi:hypothetical protein
MTELELYKYIKDNNIEWHREDNQGTPDIIIFPFTFQIDEFVKLLEDYSFDDGGLECRLKDGYFTFWMKELCEYYGIDIDKVFCEEEQQKN